MIKTSLLYKTLVVGAIFLFILMSIGSSTSHIGKRSFICKSNNPPYEPSYPIPPDGAENWSWGDLCWTGGDPDGDQVTYDVYVGNYSPPPLIILNISNNCTKYDPPGNIEFNIIYWKIVAWDEHGASTEGPIWSFTTIGNSNGNTLYVGGSGEGNYTKIQDAIDNATDGDTVFVYNGTYRENIFVDKSISLIGECREKTCILGYWNDDDVVNISADWVNISGFKILNWRNSGIKICSEYNTITSNNILNELHSMGLEIGIEICSNFNNIIDNNISHYYIYGIYLSNNTFGNYIHGNNITSESEYYEYIYGISLSDNCNNNTISENIISFNYIDIYIHSSYNNNISDNIISWDGYFGMIVESSNNNIIIDNQFLNNWHGLKLRYSNNNTITQNNFLKTICCTCISIFNSSNNLISYNYINRKKWGCCLSIAYYSYGNIIFNNKFSGGDSCIDLWESCSNNNIINNLISNSKSGIFIFSIYYPCNNNTIYHNNFINNSIKAYDEYNNTWDDGKYGNYWSDYKERYPDAKRLWLKGVWDTPYEIEGGENKDNYPLIKQWSDSRTRTAPRTQTTVHPILNWFLQRFPMLERLLNLI